MSSNNDLLRKAKKAALSAGELEMVVSALEAGASDEYTLIHILGLAGGRAQAGLVARYLRTSTDQMVLRIALKTLCDWWDLWPEFREDLLLFVRGDPRDLGGMVQVLACSIAATAYPRHRDPELIKALWLTFEDTRNLAGVRAAAYWGLARASGRDHSELQPLRSPDDDQNRDETLRWARAMIS